MVFIGIELLFALAFLVQPAVRQGVKILGVEKLGHDFGIQSSIGRNAQSPFERLSSLIPFLIQGGPRRVMRDADARHGLRRKGPKQQSLVVTRAMRGKEIGGGLRRLDNTGGWGGRDRTSEWRNQNPINSRVISTSLLNFPPPFTC
jgi:hypothetical protein